MLDYAHPESLMDPRRLLADLDKPDIRVVEVVWGESADWGWPAYRAGHIPGAIAWDFAADLQQGDDIAGPGAFTALMSRSGIGPDDTVVVYSGLNNLLATFAFWLLKVYGHHPARLLNGDKALWLEEGRPLSTDESERPPVAYTIRAIDLHLRATREEVWQSLGQPGYLLVDARPVEMFTGVDPAGTARGGRIPGAVNYPAQRVMNPDGTFKGWSTPSVDDRGLFRDASTLREQMESTGVTPDRWITTYCVRGGLSTHAWFVLTQLLGYPNVREYERSWVEWGNRAELPIAND